MNGLKKGIYILFLITAIGSAQVKRIQFVSDESQAPIQNVEVYDGNSLIGKSDPNGYLDVNTGDSDYLRTIKEDYNDSFIKVSDLQEKVTLIKSKTILLEEVVIGRPVLLNAVEISNMSIRKILNRIQGTFETGVGFGDIGKFKYRLPSYYTATNKLLMEADTLHYLKGLLNFETGKGFRIGKKFRLEKKFKYEPIHGILTYYIDKKSIEFYGDWNVCDFTMPYMIDKDYVLRSNILEKRKNYRYTVTNMGDFYKVEFVSKNKSACGFNGYLIVDKTDFGIYEFKAQLSDNTENNNKSILLPNRKEQIYHITATDYYTKYQKDKDGFYQLICSYSNKQFEQTQGNFKGKKFSQHSRVQASDSYKNIDFVDFDTYSYELK